MQIPSRYNIAAALLAPGIEGVESGRPAVESNGRVWTYEAIGALVNRAGNALGALGVRREQRVLIALPDSVEFIAAYLGAIKIGAVAVPCNTFLGPTDYAYFLSETRAPVIVTTTELLARLAPLIAQAVDVTAILVTDRDEDDGLLRGWSRWVGAASPDLTAADTHKDEAAFWLWTSGSTGTPKAAVHLHQHPAWCCELYGRATLGVTSGDRIFSAAKLFHAYGLGNSLFFPFWAGATTILYPGRATPAAVYAAIQEARPTIFFGVPTLFAAMLQAADTATLLDLSSLRCCVSAGEPLAGDLFRRWHARFSLDIFDALGSTELLHMYVASRPGRIKPGSSGVPVPGYEVKILSEIGEPLGANQVGDLHVKGPSAAIMYWNRREETKQKIRGEWFASGDKYWIDDEGFYWYAGRADDMFKVAGEWVSPIEIEAVLIQHSAVLECAVVPRADASGILTPKACVVLKGGCGPSDELIAELQTFVRARAAHYKCPRAIEFLPELPKTATGKIQRFKLRT